MHASFYTNKLVGGFFLPKKTFDTDLHTKFTFYQTLQIYADD